MLVTTEPMATTGRVSLRTLLVSPPLRLGTLVIEGDEAHHGRVVLRLRTGETVRLADGEGTAAKAVVTGVGREALEVEVELIEPVPPTAAELLTVACAVPKGDRFADLVRALAELGVGALRPLACERGERVPANLDRQRRVAAEALKQCRRGRRMEIGPAVEVTALAASGARLIVLDPSGSAAAPGSPLATTLVIGPEGGLTEAELELLASARRVRLASTILRIETAAIAASAVWIATWETGTP